MRHEALHAISGTAMAHQLTDLVPADVRHPSLTPELTVPVFKLPAGLKLMEAVAVAYRDASGKPIDGGLFGVTDESEVVSLALVDQEHGIDTSRDPAWVAFGMNMTVGKLLVKGDGQTYELPWSIVDFGEHNPNEEMAAKTPARIAVRAAFQAKRAASGGMKCAQ